MVNCIRYFFVLLFSVAVILPQSAIASLISITDISPFPLSVAPCVNYSATYKLTAMPNQTIVFKNQFPDGSVTQFTDGNFCQLKHTMDSTGICVIALNLTAPQVTFSARMNPMVKACIYGTPICERYPISVKVLELVSIAVTPARANVGQGLTQQFIANGTYDDDSVMNITSSVNWTSSNLSVATIANTGIATAVTNTGNSTITAVLGSVSNAAILTATSSTRTLVSIAVSPSAVTVGQGVTQQFIANGTYSDQSVANITSNVNWTSSNLSVATINSTGVANAVANSGTSNITANLGAIVSNVSLLTAVPGTLISIAISPTNATVNQGLNQQFIANGTYSDSSVVNITSSVNWTSSNTSIATINSTGLATAIANSGTANITASLGSVNNQALFTATPPSSGLVSITISPAQAAIVEGLTQQFIANGTYANSAVVNITANVNWTSSNTSIATINSAGIATVLTNVGTTNIIANLGTINNTAVLIAIPPGLQAITIIPTVTSVNYATNLQFNAIGLLEDNTTANITSIVNFSSSNTSIANITSSGLATVLANNGTTAITANLPGIVSGPNLWVGTGSVNGVLGYNGFIWSSVSNLDNSTAKVMVSDSSGNVYVGTNLCHVYKYNGTNWSQIGANIANSSSMYSIAIDNNNGIYVGIGTSTSGNVWGYNGTNWTKIGNNLDGRPVVSLISNSVNYLYAGTTNGNVWKYNGANWSQVGSGSNIDGSSVLSLERDSADKIYVGTNNSGVWRYNGINWTNITNNLDGGSINVLAADSNDNIYGGTSNKNVWMYNGSNWTVVGSNLDGANVQTLVVDASNNVYIGTGINGGRVWMYNGSNWTNIDGVVNANYGISSLAVASSSTLTATPAAVLSIAILPTNATVNQDANVQFSANGTYSDGSVRNVTALVNWTSSNTSIATVASDGLATAIANSGSANIQANIGAVNSSSLFEAAPPTELVSIAVTPTNVAVNKTLTQQFVAIGTRIDNTTTNLTTTANWTSSNTTVATINSTGVVSVLTNTGTTNIAASITTNNGTIVSNNSTLNATLAPIFTISIAPLSIYLTPNQTNQYIAYGVYTDNGRINLTTNVSWSSSNTTVATINSTGMATLKTYASATITATLGNINSSPGIFAGGSNTLIYYYNGTWTNSSSAGSNHTISFLASDPITNDFYYSENSGVYVYYTYDNVWRGLGTSYNFANSTVSSLMGYNTTVYVGVNNGTCYECTPYQMPYCSWTPDYACSSGIAVTGLAVDYTNQYIYAGCADSKIVRRNVTGSTWTTVNSSLDGSSIAFMGSAGDTMFVATANNNVFWYGSTMWTNATRSFGGSIRSMVVSADKAYIITNNTSSNIIWGYGGSGSTWNSLNNSYDSSRPYAITASPAASGFYYRSVNGTIWRYDTYDSTFHNIGYLPANISIMSVTSNSAAIDGY